MGLSTDRDRINGCGNEAWLLHSLLRYLSERSIGVRRADSMSGKRR